MNRVQVSKVVPLLEGTANAVATLAFQYSHDRPEAQQQIGFSDGLNDDRRRAPEGKDEHYEEGWAIGNWVRLVVGQAVDLMEP